jgi:hypothetical protein
VLHEATKSGDRWRRAADDCWRSGGWRGGGRWEMEMTNTAAIGLDGLGWDETRVHGLEWWVQRLNGGYSHRNFLGEIWEPKIRSGKPVNQFLSCFRQFFRFFPAFLFSCENDIWIQCRSGRDFLASFLSLTELCHAKSHLTEFKVISKDSSNISKDGNQ